MRLIDADLLIDDLEGVCLYDPAMARNAIKRVIRRQPTIESDTDTISRRQTLEHIKHRLYESALNNDGIASKIFEEIADNRVQIWVDELPPSPTVTADTDTISRQAAYDTLTEYYHHRTEMQHKALAEALNRVPSPSRLEWIPCSERLPEDCGNYLVSGGGNLWICEWIGSGWVNSVRNPVIESWMPLPEPF